MPHNRINTALTAKDILKKENIIVVKNGTTFGGIFLPLQVRFKA
jgi:hypothetical protein